MTLTTAIRINHPVNPLALLDHVTMLVGGNPATAKRIPPKLDDDPWDRPGVKTWRNEIGQGFQALAWVTFGVDGPIPQDEPDEEDPYPITPDPPAIVILTLDTPYSWNPPTPRGQPIPIGNVNGNDWHAYLFVQVAKWLSRHR
jgi:hypothetical protein